MGDLIGAPDWLLVLLKGAGCSKQRAAESQGSAIDPHRRNAPDPPIYTGGWVVRGSYTLTGGLSLGLCCRTQPQVVCALDP
eukprot:4128611-Pyramimonas_sp.AAC.2